MSQHSTVEARLLGHATYEAHNTPDFHHNEQASHRIMEHSGVQKLQKPWTQKGKEEIWKAGQVNLDDRVHILGSRWSDHAASRPFWRSKEM